MAEQSKGRSGRFIVGVTGNIATGKSAVMRLAADEGALAIDADKLVHEIMDGDPEMQAAIAVAFGPTVRRPDGRINRRALGQIVFSDAEALRDLEEMVHPAVYEAIFARIDASDKTLIFIEAIKLLEGKLADSCQQIWVTRCSQQRQLERLRVCRGLDTQTAAARIKSQPSQEDKVALADVVVDTNGSMAETEAQFFDAWSKLPDAGSAPTAAPAPEAPQVETEKETPPAEKTTTRTRLTKETARLLNIPKPKPQSKKKSKKESPAPQVEAQAADDGAALEVRRARPSDIPSILLLIQRATDGALKMKRSELLLAFSERSYFIGQVGTEVSAIMGWNIDYQVARIDQIFIHPIEAVSKTGVAIIEEIEASAAEHICELIVGFIALDAPSELRALFESQGYEETDKDKLPQVWQTAVEESQPEGTILLTKVLRDERLKKARVSK